MELLAENVFDSQEIWHDNAFGIAKAYMSMQVAFKKNQAARINGDYGPEQAYYNATSTP